jgi:predicted Zn-dependent protease
LDKNSAMRLVRTAADELDRAMRLTRAPGYPRPYYISYLVRDEEKWRLQAKYGATSVSTHDRKRDAFVDVRVGSYRYDQVREGGLDDNDRESESFGYVDLPFAGSEDGVRHGLWRLTDARYREAVEELWERRSRELTYLNRHKHLRSFEKRPPAVDLAWTPFPEVDVRHWTSYVERASRIARDHPDVKDSFVEFEAEHICRVFVNSEGSRQVECHPIWSVECYLWLMSPTGDAMPWAIKHTVADPAELPDARQFHREIRVAIERLRLVVRAPSLRSFSGPALLEPRPAGLLVHEAVGHRLEGSRLLATGEGQTFKDSLGSDILPPFLTIRDDPSRPRFEGRSLIGHYRYDDEGVRAQDALLVERGKLRSFLTTRTGLAPRHRSNGHARCAYHERPISRMGVLIAESENGVSDRELKRVLLEQIHEQRAPFGLRVVEASSGETATDTYNFQAFLGEVNLAAKVFPDGREQWIRGVNFVGTPLNAIRGIVAAGQRYEVDNAFCGAESGYVPVSTVSPALVVRELELQSKADTPYRPHALPIPWDKRAGGTGRGRR